MKKTQCLQQYSKQFLVILIRSSKFASYYFFLKVGPNPTSFIYYYPFYRTYKYTMTNKFSSSTGFWIRVPWHRKLLHIFFAFKLKYQNPRIGILCMCFVVMIAKKMLVKNGRHVSLTIPRKKRKIKKLRCRFKIYVS